MRPPLFAADVNAGVIVYTVIREQNSLFKVSVKIIVYLIIVVSVTIIVYLNTKAARIKMMRAAFVCSGSICVLPGK